MKLDFNFSRSSKRVGQAPSPVGQASSLSNLAGPNCRQTTGTAPANALARPTGNPPSSVRRDPFHHSRQSGIALVITLIMLSVTLVMAVSFLAISNRERGSVTTGTDANHARLAAESALAGAEGQIIASMFSTTNPYNFGLLVSTNFTSYHGFVPGLINPTNVNYSYLDNGSPLTAAEMLQNIANLQILPRAPVFVPRNGAYDFRYYLDLNRNGAFDDTGTVTNWQMVNNSIVQNGMVSQIGDPQWIGVLEHPDVPHGPGNRFIGRYCFIAVPVGNTLDVNAIYNDSAWANIGSASANMSVINDAYERNEGVGTWELNLAAFLADLNTNEWDSSSPHTYSSPYFYRTPSGAYNSGSASEDAYSLLAYRYSTNVFNETNVTQFPNLSPGFKQGFGTIDEFGAGPLMTNSYLPPAGFYSETTPWPGSPNTNLFFTPADFFNRAKTQIPVPPGFYGFTDRLLQAGTNTFGVANGQVPTYDRYTFYRMLSQLGSDSAPESGKINLNFANVDANGNVVPNAETNFTPWNPLQFFTVAADRLLKMYTTNWFTNNYVYVVNGTNYTAYNYYFTNTFGATNSILSPRIYSGPFGITNIPVLINGQFVYTPAVQRLLQLAANMYDATTTNFYPSVFRPLFAVSGSNVFISGYQQVTNIQNVSGDPRGDPRLAQPVDISRLASHAVVPVSPSVSPFNNTLNVYGVPWIIGAKKGLPNFNELNVLNAVQVSRLIQVSRNSTNNFDSANYLTNQMFLMNITNSLGASLWNSYNNSYQGYQGVGPVTIYVQDFMQVILTNAQNYGSFTTNFEYYQPNAAPWSGSLWTYNHTNPVPASFYFTNWALPFLPTAAYQYPSGNLISLNASPSPTWQTSVTYNYPFPQFGYMTTNWLQAFVLDGPNVVDYVQFSGPNRTRNLTAELADPNYPDGTGIHYMWSTNAYPVANSDGSPPYGEVNQILLSRGTLPVSYAPPGGTWSTAPVTPGGDSSPAAQQAFFGGFFTPSWTYQGVKYVNSQYVAQAPYTPTRTIYDYTLWQANDPLVHYTASDLSYYSPGSTGLQKTDIYPPVFNVSGLSLNQLGNRFQPWGFVGQMNGLTGLGVDNNPTNMSYKDPQLVGPDAWAFPTNLFPDVGWLGRVHRGTPWQTVYLKSTNLLSLANFKEPSGVANGLATWQIWTGNTGTNSFDAINASPVYDRWLFDLFTTAPSDTATLGQLSVNQTHLAAWSALLSGIPIYTNFAGTNLFAQPAGLYGTNYIPGNPASYLGFIWNNIQQTRTNTSLFPSQAFIHVGDICAVPALSDASPYLQGLKGVGVNDEMYEWLAQHTLSQLKVGTPRYVIYCYGQALKPAQNGIVGGGTYALMCTNYQIVAETAVRAVVQVENANSANPTIVIKNVNPLPPDQ